MLLGVLVAVVQTLVFILLSMVYIGSAMEGHGEH
jgi:F0F1-type ATP synthase membrane subunit a